MTPEEIRELARERWFDDGSGDEYTVVHDLMFAGSSDLALYIFAMARSKPPGAILATIGTDIVESMYYSKMTGDEIVEVLRATGLGPIELVEILGGVYPDMLAEMGMRELLRGVVAPAHIDWLLDQLAPRRGESL